MQIRASTAEEAPMPTKLRPQTVVYVPGPGIMDDRRSDTTNAPHSERHPETQETTQRIGDSGLVTAEIVDTFQTEYDMRQKIMREAVCAEIVTQADIQSVRRKQLCIFIVMILLLIGGGLVLGLLMPGRNRKSTTIQHETYPPRCLRLRQLPLPIVNGTMPSKKYYDLLWELRLTTKILLNRKPSLGLLTMTWALLWGFSRHKVYCGTIHFGGAIFRLAWARVDKGLFLLVGGGALPVE
jgi:hypothetical protein